MIRLRQLAGIGGTLTTFVGIVHFVVGLQEYVWPSYDALWFHGTGMGLLLAGGLTMLVSSKRAWRALGVVALAANLLGLGLATAFSVLSGWSGPQGLVLMALFIVGALGCVPTLRQA